MESNVASTCPPEILEKIFSLLELKELLACSQVCVKWYQVANCTKSWKTCSSMLNCELCELDDVTTNFTNTLDGIKSVFLSTLLPVNPVKLFFIQRNFLKSGWTDGVYALQVLQPEDCQFEQFVEVIYPSKAPQDCLYYPILGTRKNGEVDFYLIRLDASPRIVYELVHNVKVQKGINYTRLHTACVMRDYVVWVTENRVQCLAVNGDLNKAQVQTLVNMSCIEYSTYITMDAEHILAACDSSCFIWSKKTLELKFSRDMLDQACLYGYPCLADGYLFINCTDKHAESEKSTVEVYNLTSNNDKIMHQNEFFLDGLFRGIHCSKTCIVIHHLDCSSKYEWNDVNTFKIIDKTTLKIKFLLTSRFKVNNRVRVVDDRLLEYSYAGNVTDLTIWNLLTGEMVKKELSVDLSRGHFVFDNILVTNIKESIEVWDWLKNVRLYSLLTRSYKAAGELENGLSVITKAKTNSDAIPRSRACFVLPHVQSYYTTHREGYDALIHVSETRMVTLSPEGTFKVYGFG